VCGREGNFQEASDCARRSAEIQPRFTPSLIAYANALGFLGRYEEAREVMTRATAMNPHLSQEAYLGLVLSTTGSPERAEAHIGGLFAAGIYKR
jgi:tetratricopeptide (TPR) repeat protein